MNSPFSFSKYAGVAAAAVWTLGWVLVADLAVNRYFRSGSGGALFNAIVAIVGIAFGGAETFWFYPRKPGINSSSPSPPEPWYRRAMGWFAATVWCFAAVVWNLATFGTLARSAIREQSLNFVILIPFSLIGLFLLLLLFVGITLVMDTVLQLGDVTPTPATTEPVKEPAAPPSPPIAGPIGSPPSSPSSKSEEPAAESSFKKSPILTTLALLSLVNWFVFFGVSLYSGGDAVGVLPSRDGFVVTSHGHHTAVSESAWAFSLYYSTATRLLTPLIWLLYAARMHGSKFKTAKWPTKIFISIFLVVWVVGWYSSIGRSFYRSREDWLKLKHPTPTLEPSRQSPDTALLSRRIPHSGRRRTM